MEPKSSVATCPINGKTCVDGVRSDFDFIEVSGVKKQYKCRLWKALAGKDPQSNEVINDYDCAWSWMPLIGIENSQMTRHVVAQVSEGTKAFVDALPEEVQKRVLNKASVGLVKTLLSENVDKLIAPLSGNVPQIEQPK